jgi:protein TonB
MRRRRRQQNPLLLKMVAIGIVVTAVILPVLAKFGLFKQMHTNYVETQLVSLPPPPKEPKQEPPKAKKTVHPHVEAHHGEKAARGSHSAPLPVHVAVAKSSTGGDENAVENGTHTNLGQVQIPPATTPPVPAPAVVVPPTPAPVPPLPAPAPTPDVIVEAEPTYQPLPVMPDDLLDSDIDLTFFGYFTVHADGMVDVKVVQGTGNSILDRLALDAAKQWKFTPATKNGLPIDSFRRLQVEFVVG